MLEQTVLRDESELAQLLADEWGLRLDSATHLGEGSANCRIVLCAGERFFLKEFQRSMSQQQAQQERQILAHLANDGIAVSRVLATRSGAGFAVCRGRLFQLQAHLPGQRIAKHEAPAWLLEELALTLARIVRSLAAFPLLANGYARWFGRNIGQRARQLRRLADQLESAAWLGDERARLRASALARADIVAALPAWNPSAARLSIGNSHGDYSILQILCAGKTISGVVDFASACRLPWVWEVARSFTYAHPASKHGELDAAALADYLAAFESVVPLSADDREHMLTLYLYQLAPSLYGFRQLAAGPMPNQSELSEFACWRTALCRTLLSLLPVTSRHPVA